MHIGTRDVSVVLKRDLQSRVVNVADLCCGTAWSFQRSIGIFGGRHATFKSLHVPCSTCRHWTSFGADEYNRYTWIELERVHLCLNQHRWSSMVHIAAQHPHAWQHPHETHWRKQPHTAVLLPIDELAGTRDTCERMRCESATRAGCLSATSHRLGLSMVRLATRWYLSNDLARAARL